MRLQEKKKDKMTKYLPIVRAIISLHENFDRLGFLC